MKILLIEPYYSGSHKDWADGLKKHSSHDIEILALPGSFWKWRMQGGAISLARKFNEGNYSPDLILATDMLDVTTFVALTRNKIKDIPLVVYFHENQLSYPWAPNNRDKAAITAKHYGFINYSTALFADAVWFNSSYHHDSFMDEIGVLLKKFPDFNELETIEKIRKKSSVMHLGLDLQKFDKFKVEDKDSSVPIILWNHRWEYDKNPEGFFRAMYDLYDSGMDFKLVVLGESYHDKSGIFVTAKEQLQDKILHWGFAKSFEEYAGWLWQSDILPVTNIQDFFGASVMEAVYCDTIPLLPRRLAYPEIYNLGLDKGFTYDGDNQLAKKLKKILEKWPVKGPDLKDRCSQFDWGSIIEKYDAAFTTIG